MDCDLVICKGFLNNNTIQNFKYDIDEVIQYKITAEKYVNSFVSQRTEFFWSLFDVTKL